MDMCKINEQIERLEQELAKLKAEANKPSKYEIEYKAGSAFFVSPYSTTGKIVGFSDDGYTSGRYRKTEKFANEHFKTQNEIMRLGALIEAVTIGMNMEDWVADWNDEDQTKHYVQYDCKGGEYTSGFRWTFRTIGVIYMPQKVAERVCGILNNKEYELSGVNYGDRT